MNTLVEQLKLVDNQIAIFTFVFFFSLVAPGLLTICYCFPGMFKELETIKLLLLSISICVPGVVVPFFISHFANVIIRHVDKNNTLKVESIKTLFYSHGINNGISMYFVLLVCFLFQFEFITVVIGYAIFILFNSVGEFYRLFQCLLHPEKQIDLELKE